MRSTSTPGTSRRCRRLREPTGSASATSRSITLQPKFGAWVQDDWRISDRLTLNLGVRWDLSVNASANDIAVAPFLEAGRPNDTNNYQPRVGFAYQLNDRTVVRGGSGIYFYEPITSDTLWTVGNSLACDHSGDQRWAAELRRRPVQRTASADVRPGAGAVLPRQSGRRDVCESSLTELRLVRWNIPGDLGAHLAELHRRRPPDSAATMAVEVDYVYSRGRNEKDIIDNVEPDVQPGYRRELSVQRRQPACRSRIGATSRSSTHGRVGATTGCRPASPSAWPTGGRPRRPTRCRALWDAESPPFTGDPATSRFIPVPVRDGAGYGWRVGALGRATSAIGRVQRHLGGRPRLPGERPRLLRLRAS